MGGSGAVKILNRREIAEADEPDAKAAQLAAEMCIRDRPRSVKFAGVAYGGTIYISLVYRDCFLEI